MTELTEKQRRKLLATADIVEHGDIAVLTKLLEFYDFFQENKEEFMTKMEELSRLNTDKSTAGLVKVIEELLIRASNLETDAKNLSELGEKERKNVFLEIKNLKSDLKDVLKEIEKVRESIPELPPETDLTDMYNKLVEVEKKIPKIPDEIKPEQVRDKLEFLEDEERLKIKSIHKLQEELDELKKKIDSKVMPMGGGSSGGGRIVKTYDLSSSLDGVLKTFSLPAFCRVLVVHLASSPFSASRPTTDYTIDYAYIANAAPTLRYDVSILPISNNIYELGTTTLKWFRSWTSYASTTQLSADSLCLNSDTCRTTWPTGGSGTFSWTPTSWGVSTSTTLGFLNGFLSTASSTINSNLLITGNSTTTNATTTAFAVSSLTSALLQTNANGSLDEYAGTTCTNQFVRVLSALGVATCATVDISADTNLAGDTEVVLTGDALSLASTIARDTELPVGANPTGTIGLTAVNGVATTFLRSDGAPALSQSITPTWTGAHIFANITRSTTTSATTTNLFSTTASSTTLSVGTTFNFLGTVITNVATWFSGLFDSNLATKTLADITGCTDCLNATDIEDIYLLDDGDVGTGVYDFGGATSFEIPNGTGPTLNAIGQLAWDITSGNLAVSTSTTGHVVIGGATTTLYAFAVASTSPDFISGGTIELPAHFLAQTAIAVICEADAGTSVVINLSDSAASADSNAATCTTTSTQFQLTSNNSYAAYAAPRLEFGTITGSVDRLSIRIIGYRTSN